MATVLPDNPAAQLRFFEAHSTIWLAAPPSAIGLTDAQAAAVAATTAQAAEAFAAAQEARLAALAATQTWRNAAEHLRDVGGLAIRTIKMYAEATNNPNVFSAGGIDPPHRPGPNHRTDSERANALPRIRTCEARPDALGNINVEWTCGQGATMGAGANMMYQLTRSLDGAPFTFLEIVGSPGSGRRTVRFTDDSVPTGTRQVAYMVTPMRGSARGTVGPVASVQFGSGSGGAAAISTGLRKAA